MCGVPDAPHKKGAFSLAPVEGLLEERRAGNAFLRVLVRAGGSSGVGWPSRFLSALGGAGGGLLSRNGEIQLLDEAMQRSGQVLLCVFKVP